MAYRVLNLVVAGSTTGNNVTTTATSTIGVDLIVIVLSYAHGVVVTLTDNQSNTWSLLTGKGNAGFSDAQIAYCQAPITNASHTFTLSSTSGSPGLHVLLAAGSTASPFDQQNGASAVNATNLSTGSITPTTDGQLIVSGLSNNLASPQGRPTVVAPMAGEAIALVSAQHFCSGLAYWVQPTAAAINVNWNWDVSVSINPAAVVASFKAGATATGSGGSFVFA